MCKPVARGLWLSVKPFVTLFVQKKKRKEKARQYPNMMFCVSGASYVVLGGVQAQNTCPGGALRAEQEGLLNSVLLQRWQLQARKNC